MPCHDHQGSEERDRIVRDYPQTVKRNDLLARMLCKALDALESVGANSPWADPAVREVLSDPEVAAWWKEHKAFDKTRTEKT